jgi:glucan 1,3-beta-glucosidase
MREITGYGEGNGPYMAIHDGFAGPATWSGFMRGADRVAMDYHPYFAFGGDPSPPTIDTGVGAGAGGPWPSTACTRFGGMTNNRLVF